MLELILGLCAIISTVFFIIFIVKGDRAREKSSKPQKKQPKKQKPKPTKPKDEDEIPEEWKENNPSSSMTYKSITFPKIPKFRLRGLKSFKRFIAFILFIVNFVISQVSLMSPPATQPMFWLFFLNAFILLDYLWKTKGKEAT